MSIFLKRIFRDMQINHILSGMQLSIKCHQELIKLQAEGITLLKMEINQLKNQINQLKDDQK